MIEKYFSLFIISFALLSCNQQGTSIKIGPVTELKTDTFALKRESVKTPVQLKGLYHPGQFKSCEDNQLYTFSKGEVLNRLDTSYFSVLPHPYPNQTVYVEVTGLQVSEQPVNTGYVFNLQLINKVEMRSPSNTCIPFDYWCTGTEPFWQLEISGKENLIDFYNPMEQTTIHFIYKKPTTKNGNIIYTSNDDSGKNKISVTLKEEKCSDGMSEKEYSHKVEVILNGKSYKGCANTFNKQ